MKLWMVLMVLCTCAFSVSGKLRREKLHEQKWKSLSPSAKIATVRLEKDENALNKYLTFKAWKNFKSRHNKTYESAEDQRRFLIFQQNKRLIEQHNEKAARGEHSHTLALNQFADMSHEEFIRVMNGFAHNYGDSLAGNRGITFLEPFHTALPEQIDWREHGYVTSVKNQEHCGSCWSFSTTGSLEGQNKRKTGNLVSLSEQNLVDCSTPYGNHGCNGGLMDQAFQYIKANGGVDTEESYPYEAKQGRCRFHRSDVGAEDVGFVDIPTGSEQKLKAAVATVGPVSVAIDASHSSFQFYNSGVYYEPDCDSKALDHGVLVVGYGVDDEEKEFWIVKNSWGPNWGKDGYILMARNRDNNCGIATKASYPLV